MNTSIVSSNHLRITPASHKPALGLASLGKSTAVLVVSAQMPLSARTKLIQALAARPPSLTSPTTISEVFLLAGLSNHIKGKVIRPAGEIKLKRTWLKATDPHIGPLLTGKRYVQYSYKPGCQGHHFREVGERA